jgi:hypothetical protein
LTPEVRYHFKEKYNGFYVGGHAGPDIYEIQKWNYWDSNADTNTDLDIV